jgi:nucleoside-diphosphate-sugar epimerase
VSVPAPTYLVTGATGFLGRHIVDSVRTANPSARILALSRSPFDADASAFLTGVERVAGSPVDVATWADNPLVERLDGIFHLAAEVRHSRRGSAPMVRFNVESTVNLTRFAASRGCRIVFASSSGTGGCSRDAGAEPDENAPWCEDVVRRWPYYASKIQAEREGMLIAAQLGADLVIARLPVLLGPGDHRFRSTGNVIRALRRRLPFLLDGEIHFTDIRDAAASMVRAMGRREVSGAYHMPGARMSLDEFFTLVVRSAGLVPQWRVIPAALLSVLTRLNDASHLRLHLLPDPVVVEMARHRWGLSSRQSEADLGYRPRPAAGDVVEALRSLARIE